MDYKEVERRYQELVEAQRAGKITQAQWEQQLKALILQDTKGRYWTIGAQTGKWYYYDGIRWSEGTPQQDIFSTGRPGSGGVASPAPTANQSCPHCGFENQGARALCSRCGQDMRKDIRGAATPRDLQYCSYCGTKMESYLAQCPRCGRPVESRASMPAQLGKPVVEELVLQRGSKADFIEASTGSGRQGNESEIRALNLASCFRFWGGAGLVVGLVSGVFFGAIKQLGQGILPDMPLLELKGRWFGGLVFGLLGAVGGGFLSGLYGVFLGFLYNLLAIIFGGIRIKTFRMPNV